MTSTVPALYRSARAGRVRVIVVHTNEGPEKEGGAAGLARYLQVPADRRGGSKGGYHEIVDDHEYVVCADDDEQVNGAAGANTFGWHVCLVGYAGQDANGWADDYSTAELRLAAQRVAAACARFGVPKRKIDAAALLRGEAGICGHADVTAAYHKSTHTDPGPNFPWAEFMGQIAPAAPPEEDGLDMTDDQLKLIVKAAVLELLDNDDVQAQLRAQARAGVMDVFLDEKPTPAARQVQSKIVELVRQAQQ